MVVGAERRNRGDLGKRLEEMDQGGSGPFRGKSVESRPTHSPASVRLELEFQEIWTGPTRTFFHISTLH